MLTRDAVRIRLISDRRVTGAGDESGQDVVREESLPECDKLVCPISVRSDREAFTDYLSQIG
jgi:hypothetical protein